MSFSRDNLLNTYSLKSAVNEDMHPGPPAKPEYDRPTTSDQQRPIYHYSHHQPKQSRHNATVSTSSPLSMISCPDLSHLQTPNENFGDLFFTPSSNVKEQSPRSNRADFSDSRKTSSPAVDWKMQLPCCDMNKLNCNPGRGPEIPLSQQQQQQQSQQRTPQQIHSELQHSQQPSIHSMKTQLKIGSVDEDYLSRGLKDLPNQYQGSIDGSAAQAASKVACGPPDSTFEYKHKLPKQGSRSFSSVTPAHQYNPSSSQSNISYLSNLSCSSKSSLDLGIGRPRSLSNSKARIGLNDRDNGVFDPSKRLQPLLSTVYWEDEQTLCFQIEVNGIVVARREDNNMINGTKLLNVSGMSRGKRDGLLKNEKVRHVVKIGAMNLKGVWIPFERALNFANRENITSTLYPIFVRDIRNLYSNLLLSARNTSHNVSIGQAPSMRLEAPPQKTQPYFDIPPSQRLQNLTAHQKHNSLSHSLFQSSLNQSQRLLPHPMDISQSNSPNSSFSLPDNSGHLRQRLSLSMKPRHQMNLSKTSGLKMSHWMPSKPEALNDDEIFSGIFDQSLSNSPSSGQKSMVSQSERQIYGHRPRRYYNPSKDYSMSQASDDSMSFYIPREENTSVMSFDENRSSESVRPTQNIPNEIREKQIGGSDLWPSINRNFKFPMSNFMNRVQTQITQPMLSDWNNPVDADGNASARQLNTQNIGLYSGNMVQTGVDSQSDAYRYEVIEPTTHDVSNEKASSASLKHDSWAGYNEEDPDTQKCYTTSIENQRRTSLAGPIGYDSLRNEQLDSSMATQQNSQKQSIPIRGDDDSERLQSVFNYDPQIGIEGAPYVQANTWNSPASISAQQDAQNHHVSEKQQLAVKNTISDSPIERFEETIRKNLWQRNPSKLDKLVSPPCNENQLDPDSSEQYENYDISNSIAGSISFNDSCSLNFPSSKPLDRVNTLQPDNSKRNMDSQSPRKYRKSVSQASNGDIHDVYWTPVI